MDQRVDNDLRSGSAQDRGAKPTDGAARDKRSWGDTLRQRWGLVILITVINGRPALLALVAWWLHAQANTNSTDDALLLSTPAPSQIIVFANQRRCHRRCSGQRQLSLVEAGTVLIRLDDRDFVAQRDQAVASVANLNAQIAAQHAKIEQADKQAEQAQATLTFAQQQADRYELLAKQGSGTVELAQQYRSNLLQSQASLAAAQANAVATRKQIPGVAGAATDRRGTARASPG